MHWRVLCIFVILIHIGWLSSFAATPDSLDQSNTSRITQLEETIKQLRHDLVSLKAAYEKKEKEEQLKKLLEEASTLSNVKKKETEGVGKKFHSGVRQQSGLNPNISVSGDFFVSTSSSDADFIREESDISYGRDRFTLRELELALEAPLDPFTRGKSFISVGKEGISIEEAYMQWLNLPGGVNLKIGIFYADFGILNRYHDHALPQFDRPKALVNLFTTSGLGGIGMSGNFILPNMLFSDASTLDLTIINGGNNQSFTSEGKYNLLPVIHWKNYYDITRNTYFEWSLSGVAGKNDPAEKYNSYIGNLGIIIKWVPIGRAKYRTIDWKTEILYSRRETPAGDVNSMGFYTSLQNKLNARYWLTGRIGYSELPLDNKQHEWEFTTNLDVWQSEFVFFRFQYQYTLREFTNYLNLDGPYPNDHSFIFHVCWAMGPHKHEAY